MTNRAGSFLLPVVFIVLFSACRQEKVFLLTDPWYERLDIAVRPYGNLDRELWWRSRTDLKHDYFKITVTDQRAAQATLDRYANAETAFVVTPLVYLWTRQVVLPAGGLVVVDGAPEWTTPGKSVVWTDRTRAMEQAGRWAAERALKKQNTVVAGIVSETTPSDKEAFESFRRGFFSLAPAESLMALTVKSSPEQMASDLTQIASRHEVAVWFLFGGTANIASREALSGVAEPIICQDAGPWIKTDRGLASVDSDRRLILKSGLRWAAGGRFGESLGVPARFKPARTKKRGAPGKITEKGFDTQ